MVGQGSGSGAYEAVRGGGGEQVVEGSPGIAGPAGDGERIGVIAQGFETQGGEAAALLERPGGVAELPLVEELDVAEIEVRLPESIV